MRQVVLYGLVGGVLVALLKVIEYQHVVRTFPGELYGGLVAAIFAALGVWLGRRWTSAPPPQGEPPAAGTGPFVRDEQALAALGLTPREHEILGLIASGLSNREIGEKLFVSENTVKTHSSRLFQKLGVSRRTQAVLKGKQLRLIP